MLQVLAPPDRPFGTYSMELIDRCAPPDRPFGTYSMELGGSLLDGEQVQLQAGALLLTVHLGHTV
jgi:hypothetical protein